MNLSEAVTRVIDLARKVREYYDAELPKYHPKYPLIGPDEEEPPPPPEEKELSDFLATLSDEMIYQLVLLMHLGRYSCTVENLAAYYDSLKDDVVGDREQAVEHLKTFEIVLADQLTDALEELHKHKINVDKLPLKKVKLRKR